MKNKQIYIKHQASDTAYNEVVKRNKQNDNGFIRPKKYHHNPAKLKKFTSYVGYLHWSGELFSASAKISLLLRRIYDNAKRAKSSWHENKNELNSILNEYESLKPSLNDLYDDIVEFQNCMLATDISEKQAEIETLSDRVKHLATLEIQIIEICNRKLYEISASRVTITNTLIAIAALFVSLLSVVYFR